MAGTTRLHRFSAFTYALNWGLIGLSLPFFVLLVLGGIFDAVPMGLSVVLAPLGLVLGIGYGIVYYLRFEYGFTNDTFDVGSGVISRRSREIPYRRIQNVDVRQSVFLRLLGLATVAIETAGGGSTEARLSFVSQSEADRLQREIRRRTARAKRAERSPERNRETAGQPDPDRSSTITDSTESRSRTDDDAVPMSSDGDEDAPGVTDRPFDDDRSVAATDPSDEGDAEKSPGASTGDDPSTVETAIDPVEVSPGPDEPAAPRGERDPTTELEGSEPWGDEEQPTPLFDLKSRELLLYSFTTLRPAAAAGVVFIAFFGIELVMEYLLLISQPVGGPDDLATGTPLSYVVLSVVSLVNAVVVTYVISVVYTFATYYDFTLGRAADDFVYERGLLQRYSGSIPAEKVQSVTITDNPVQRRIGYAGLWVETAGYGPDSSSGGSQSAIPLAQQRRVFRFAERLTEVDPPRFKRPSPIARRRYVVRYGLIASVFVALVFAISIPTTLDRWYFAAVVYLAVPIAAHLRYVHLGYFVGDDHLVIRRGFWRRRTTVIPYYRIQTISTRRSIFQRRLGIASVVVDTASSRSFFWPTPKIYDVNIETARSVNGDGRSRLQTALSERRDEGGVSVAFT